MAHHDVHRRIIIPALVLIGWLTFLFVPLRVSLQQQRVYRIDPAHSQVEVNVFKGGWLKAFGHDHLISTSGISGEVRVSPQALDQASVKLHIESASLVVLDPQLKADDREKVQQDMRSEKVLDVGKYSAISFASKRVSDMKSGSDGIQLSLSGDLSLHGATRAITVPVSVTLADESLRARGKLTLKQTDYQITPISAFGVRVKDEIQIVFDLTAARQH
jgi:polyisoprenoid-binding protein YceI